MLLTYRKCLPTSMRYLSIYGKNKQTIPKSLSCQCVFFATR